MRKLVLSICLILVSGNIQAEEGDQKTYLCAESSESGSKITVEELEKKNANQISRGERLEQQALRYSGALRAISAESK